jgi:hypothetical protein
LKVAPPCFGVSITYAWVTPSVVKSKSKSGVDHDTPD